MGITAKAEAGTAEVSMGVAVEEEKKMFELEVVLDEELGAEKAIEKSIECNWRVMASIAAWSEDLRVECKYRLIRSISIDIAMKMEPLDELKKKLACE